MRYAVYIPTADRGAMRPAGDIVADIERVERAGYESAWIMDHILVDRDGRRGAGHDPLPVLAAAGARTRRIGLGTLVLGDPFRPIWQTAREAAALADLTGGRFRLGLGAGWHKPEFDAFGIPFDRLVSRFAERLPLLRRLLAGERVSHDGAEATLADAQIFAIAPPPPIWVAGGGPRMLRLTARHADGWNIAWGGADPAWMTEALATLRRELDAAGRDAAAFTTSAGVLLGPGTTERDVVALARAYEAIGLDLLIMTFADRPGGEVDPEGIEKAARALEIAA